MDENTNAPQPRGNRADDVDPVEIAEPRDKENQPALSRKPLAGRERPLSDEEARKVPLIEEACQARDRAALARLAVSEHGLVVDRLRKIACGLHPAVLPKFLLTSWGQGLYCLDVMVQETRKMQDQPGKLYQSTATRTK
jgi:hypothetical protein